MFDTKFAEDVFLDRYSMDKKETWSDTVDRVVTAIGYSYIRKHMEDRVFMPAGRYLHSCGRPVHNILNCFGFLAEDSREGWARLMHDTIMTLSMGGGVGVNYSMVRPNKSPIKGAGGYSSGPISLMQMLDATAFHIKAGGSRRSALWAGISWDHKDWYDFISCKIRSEQQKQYAQECYDRGEDVYLPLSLTNLSVIFDPEFFVALANKEHKDHIKAQVRWFDTARKAFQYADPGWTFGDRNLVQNACTEFRSETSGDSCNLGTIFLNRIKNKDHMAEITKHAVKFMLRGALYTNRPTEQSRQVARENNRIGLGLGGISEWLISRGYGYEMAPELRELLEVWAEVSEKEATKYAKKLGMNVPKNFRAIAPNGTIAVVAETTGGIEPVFCKAYKRRWFKDGQAHEQIVIDPTVKRLLNKGIPIENIWDAYDLSFEQRVKFQADVQDYVDMGISSTVNLPEWGSEQNNENNVAEKLNIVLKYAPRLKGLTVYPDGAIIGQPLSRISLEEGLKREQDVVVEQQESTCKNGICGV